MPNVITRIEPARGCGYRKGGGTYLIADGLGMECGKLPIPLTVCPTCHAGIHPARGWTWISPKLFAKAKCKGGSCGACPMNEPKGKMGLLWIGEKFYQSPRDFTNEAAMIGVSRRIAQIPNDFEIGKTWVCVAHRKAIQTFDKNNQPQFTPGIFHAFKPSRIEYVVRGDETDEELEAKEKRGFTLVKVIRDVDAQQTLSL